MKISLVLTIFMVLVAAIFAECIIQANQLEGSPAASQLDKPLSLAKLPAEGRILLTSDNEKSLSNLGLGGSKPLNAPPHFPFNSYGLYWSDQFSLVEGDLLSIIIYSASPVSWFGVDWSNLDVRGVFALTDTDEDGWNFIALYPQNSSVETGTDGVTITLNYAIMDNDEYQILVKNSNTSKSAQLSMAVAVQSQSMNNTRDPD